MCNFYAEDIEVEGTWLTMSKQIVTVKQGKLGGAVLKSALGSLYIAFRGIPFAAPPVGDLRFKVYIYNIFYILYYFTLLTKIYDSNHISNICQKFESIYFISY